VGEPSRRLDTLLVFVLVVGLSLAGSFDFLDPFPEPLREFVLLLAAI